MNCALIAFTEEGRRLAQKTAAQLDSAEIFLRREGERMAERMPEIFSRYEGIVFFCATGIAVRLIAPYLRDKTLDPAVVVCDDTGAFAISLLSGHLGGANALAERVAAILGATPVVTTASDRRGLIGIDLFAQSEGLVIEDIHSVAPVMCAVVDGRPVHILDTRKSGNRYPYPSAPLKDAEAILAITDTCQAFACPCVFLRPRSIVAGIGCRRNVSKDAVEAAFAKACTAANVSPYALRLVRSVDRKAQEAGIVDFAAAHGVPFETASAEVLAALSGHFQGSAFVQSVIGVESVSARAAVLGGETLLLDKWKGEGVTVSLARRNI